MRRLFHRRKVRWALLGVGALAVGLFVTAALVVPLPERLSARHSRVIEYRDGTVAHVFLADDDKWRVRVRLETLDPAYVPALLALEDKRFFQHPGVDPLAALRALGSNLFQRRRVSGASTLTMQLVRVLEPRPRTLTSKLIESFRAMQLELFLTKEEILTGYLQFIPYGRNVEGLEAASLAYFGHRANALSPAEMATLLAVPQRPGQRFPAPAHVQPLKAARDGIAAKLLAVAALPLGNPRASAEAVLAEVRATSVPRALRAFPREAPHAALFFAAQRPNQETIRTTLDQGAQRLAQQVMARGASEQHLQGIHNGAAVVVDRSGAVRALVGNADFWDVEHGGQIIGFDVPRSPGSALKPLLYALAIDRGLAGPTQMVPDVPTQFGTYAPRNFDDDFDGLVRLEEALSRSLNIPFVHLLRAVGVDAFLAALGVQGVTSLERTPNHYGLSAIVGGLELSPLELSAVYLTLANDGVVTKVRWSADDDERAQETTGPAAADVVLYAPGAAFLTRQALSIKDRPDFPSRRRLTGAPPEIHWKTGTSFGHRDAWAAGSGSAYTAVVWVGNFDNAPSSHLVGSEAAGPLLFDLLEALSDKSRPVASKVQPPDLTQVEVCAFSGYVATEACPSRRLTLALRKAVPTVECPFHTKLDVDVASGLALSPKCRGEHQWETKTFVHLPTAVRRYFTDRQRGVPQVPEWAKGCEPGGRQSRPVIVSPAPGQVKLLLAGVPAEKQEVALEAELGDPGSLSWFVDGKFLGTFAADERAWWTPSVGKHEVAVFSEAGLGARQVLEVRTR